MDQNKLPWTDAKIRSAIGDCLKMTDKDFEGFKFVLPIVFPKTTEKIYPKEGSIPLVKVGEMYNMRLYVSENCPAGTAELRWYNPATEGEEAFDLIAVFDIAPDAAAV